MSKGLTYTPGPWFWEVDGSLYNWREEDGKAGYEKEVIGVHVEGEANAIPAVHNPADRRLIQMAPQILEGLKSVVKSFRAADVEKDFCDVMDKIVVYVELGTVSVPKEEPEKIVEEESVVNG